MRRLALAALALGVLIFPVVGRPLPAHATRAFMGCRFDMLTLSFGQYDVFSYRPTPILGSLHYSCSHVKDDVEVGLSAGNSNRVSDRYMVNAKDATQHLRYQLWLDRSFTRIFGDGFGGTDDVDINPGKEEGTIHIFGKVYPRQDVLEGRYSDELELTVNY